MPGNFCQSKDRALYECPQKKMNSEPDLLYQTEKQSLKLNLWKLFYRKNTKLRPTYKPLLQSLAAGG